MLDKFSERGKRQRKNGYVREAKRKDLTSVSTVCRGQAQAAVQEAEGMDQAPCVGRIQPPCYITH